YVEEAKKVNPNTPDSAIGLIYQDVIKVLPQMSCKGPKDEYGSLNYLNTDYINLIAASCQQTHLRLNSHEREMKEKIKELEDKIVSLENTIKNNLQLNY